MFHCVQLSFCGTNCRLSYLITAPNICYSDDYYVFDITSVTEITALSNSPRIIKCVQYHATAGVPMPSYIQIPLRLLTYMYQYD